MFFSVIYILNNSSGEDGLSCAEKMFKCQIRTFSL